MCIAVDVANSVANAVVGTLRAFAADVANALQMLLVERVAYGAT